jgi:glucose-6-phosphate isomerase/transaldolase/glucose-6-phosphate isomerase
VADEPLGEPEVYGEDRVFVYLHDQEGASEELEKGIEALSLANHPTLTLATRGASDLGRIFFLAEFAVAVAGWVLEINPFDQPNVQEAKDNTQRVLDSGSIPQFASADDDALRALLADAGPPHYVDIQGYLPYSAELEAAVAELREVIRRATHAATTFGYGPRFQHSTGQLHKGGPPVGRFLQLVNQPTRDAEIPGAGYSFAKLIAAQAAGELQTLHNHGLSAERVGLEGDPAQAVRDLTQRIRGLLE